MNTKTAFLTCVFVASCVIATGLAAPLPKTPPCDIVNTMSHFVIPRIHCEKPTTLNEALDWILHQFNGADRLDAARSTFTFEYRLSQATLNRPVTIDAKDITMIEAIKQIFGNTYVMLTFETGKLVFMEPTK